MITKTAHRAWRISLLLIVVMAFAATAQAGTTGQLSGFVVDEEGSPLPGVSVSASSPTQIGGVLSTQTDTEGWFQYPRLSPGIFTVRLELEGFLTQDLTEVQVRLDRMTRVHVTMPLATFPDEIIVTETTPVVDPTQVSAGQTFTSDYIQEAALGMENRTYLGMLTQAAGVDRSWTYGFRVLGSTPFDNNFLVDGMDTTDSGYQVPSFGSISIEAVDEVVLHTAGFEAEFGRATGGVVNLVTKSGGNRLRGSVDYRYSDSGFHSSGDHFDPEEQPTKTSDLNASLGGPFVRDRLWFFAALQNFNQDSTPTGAPATENWSEQNYLGKVTWQTTANWLLMGKLIFNPREWNNSGVNQFEAPEATWVERWDALSGQLDLSGVLTDQLLFGLRFSSLDTPYEFVPQDGDLTTIGHVNLDTGERYGNADGQSYENTPRTEIDTDLSWFLDHFGGSHDFKGGLKYTDSGVTNNHCFNGSGRVCSGGVEGYQFLDILEGPGDPIPFSLWIQEAMGQQEFTGSILSAYLQDSWRIRPDLTLKLGARWDSSKQTNDAGEEIVDLSMLQPRIGLAWDITGNGRNLVRAFWGQFMHPSSLHIAGFAAQAQKPGESWLSCTFFISSDPESCAAIAEAEGLGYRSDPEAWDPAGWFLDPGSIGRTEPNQIAEDLEPAYADELVLAYERELFRRTSLEVSYVKKNTKALFEDTCNGNVPVPTEGSDCSYFLVTNLPGLRNDYEALMLRFESRAHDRMHVIGSYVYSDSKGSVPGWDVTQAYDLYPWHFVNQYGYLPDHSRHRIKLNGYVNLPLDFSLAINSWWSSEFRWTPWGNRRVVPEMQYGRMAMEPRGSRSEPGVYQLDLQVGKGFQLGRTRLRLLGTVYNVLDSETASNVCRQVVGCGEFELGDPIKWQIPRRYELGLRVEF